MNRPGGRAYRPPCPRLDLDPLRPGPRTRIENPIHNGPQATVLGDMALQRCWHAWIQDLVAHRRKEAAEVGEIKGVLRIFDLPIGQPAVQMDCNLIHLTSPLHARRAPACMGCSLFFVSDLLSSKRALRHPTFSSHHRAVRWPGITPSPCPEQ